MKVDMVRHAKVGPATVYQKLVALFVVGRVSAHCFIFLQTQPRVYVDVTTDIEEKIASNSHVVDYYQILQEYAMAEVLVSPKILVSAHHHTQELLVLSGPVMVF